MWQGKIYLLSELSKFNQATCIHIALFRSLHALITIYIGLFRSSTMPIPSLDSFWLSM